MRKRPVIKVDGKFYIADAGAYHQDAINLWFAGKTDIQIAKLYEKASYGKLAIEFGFADDLEGNGYEVCNYQESRLIMYNLNIIDYYDN